MGHARRIGTSLLRVAAVCGRFGFPCPFALESRGRWMVGVGLGVWPRTRIERLQMVRGPFGGHGGCLFGWRVGRRRWMQADSVGSSRIRMLEEPRATGTKGVRRRGLSGCTNWQTLSPLPTDRPIATRGSWCEREKNPKPRRFALDHGKHGILVERINFNLIRFGNVMENSAQFPSA